jgi:DNA-binding transcriptional LysR family regulator
MRAFSAFTVVLCLRHAAGRPREDDELAVTPLWTDTLNVALLAKHRLAKQKQVSDYLSLLWRVASGLGIAVATDRLRDLQRDGMVWKPLCDATKAARMLLVTRKDEASPTLMAFRKLAAKYEQRHGRRG